MTTTHEDLEHLSDEELLALPDSNLSASGDLVRIWTRRAEAHQRHEVIEAIKAESIRVERILGEERRREERQEFETREARLLAQLRERDAEIETRRRDIDQRAIKLADGRRAYVDGDNYRDATGRELTGADRAQAEQGHLERSNASTWQEHSKVEADATELTRIREHTERLQAAGQTDAAADKALTRYEQELTAQTDARKTEIQKAPTNYGTGADPSNDLDDLASAFKPAAQGIKPVAIETKDSVRPVLGATPNL